MSTIFGKQIFGIQPPPIPTTPFQPAALGTSAMNTAAMPPPTRKIGLDAIEEVARDICRQLDLNPDDQVFYYAEDSLPSAESWPRDTRQVIAPPQSPLPLVVAGQQLHQLAPPVSVNGPRWRMYGRLAKESIAAWRAVNNCAIRGIFDPPTE